MNKKAITALEFTKIIDQLVQKASSPLGKRKCEELTVHTDITLIQHLQQQTQDALSRLFQKGSTSFGNVRDITPSLKRLEVGSALSIPELLSISALLENTARIKSYGRPMRDEDVQDSLSPLFEALQPLTPLSQEIRRCILSEEEISDDASPALRQIRRSMRIVNDRIHTQLSAMRDGALRTYLQDPVITMRDGRYCLPVKTEYKQQVPGMIHDQSASGSTVFIEPMAVVKLNNDFRQLELDEQREIDVILATLSELAAVETEALTLDLETLVELDFIFARSSLALKHNATLPVFNTEGIVELRKARHPLIHKKKVVPIDIRLGTDFTSLIVTGPNTGGKTVSLKTVGLLTLMGQAGLHIPAGDRSRLSVFREVYADIGDEQSIEQSLSTFSSHMTNIISFIEDTNADCLVLFDELGAGTDPTEGAALAIAILSYMHQKDIRVMATTHYSELKVYALSTPGVENASCEFDVETLQPTYRLLIGVPGKSNAFAISLKLGLPEHIIDRAKEQISQENKSFEDLLSDLEQSRIALDEERSVLQRHKEEAAALQDRLNASSEKLAQQKQRLIQTANEEAHKILQEAKDYADQTIKSLNQVRKAHVPISEVETKRQTLRKKMTDIEGSLSRPVLPKPQTQKLTASEIRIGDTVRIPSLNTTGIISTLPDKKGNVFVQIGGLRTQVAAASLQRAPEIPAALTQSAPAVNRKPAARAKSLTISPEINLLGLTVDEAVAKVDKYLDDAYLSHLTSVRIVHGKGTGALRKGIQAYLKTLPYVDSYRLGEFGEGDAGVTIVSFK
ncbi:MAG: endonuclease MutS2 [Lachnospiraceae bacterium]